MCAAGHVADGVDIGHPGHLPGFVDHGYASRERAGSPRTIGPVSWGRATASPTSTRRPSASSRWPSANRSTTVSGKTVHASRHQAVREGLADALGGDDENVERFAAVAAHAAVCTATS